ncbi:MAG: hypothetical protein RLZZ58_949 [Pseudomonadota bacterium]
MMHRGIAAALRRGGRRLGTHVFISYSSKDRAVGNAVCARLEARGHRCWIAPRDIVPGTEWGEAIVGGIRGAGFFVLIFSHNANASPQILREVERAVHHGLPIIPFRIEDIAPEGSLEYFMSVPHWFDALSPPLDDHIERLADVIDTFAASGVLPETAVAPRPRGIRAQVRAALPAALAGGGLAALLAALWVGDLAPPGGGVAMIGVGIAMILAPAAFAAGVGRRIARTPWLLRGIMLLLCIAALFYMWLFGHYVVAGPPGGAALVRGSVCTADAGLLFGAACPDLPADALADAAWDPAMLWTPQSIARAAQGLAAGWLAMATTGALLIAAWFARTGRR